MKAYGFGMRCASRGSIHSVCVLPKVWPGPHNLRIAAVAGRSRDSRAGEIRVLGSVELVAATGPLELRTMQRRLLAALVIAHGAAVPVDALIETLWPGGPPASAPNLLRIYVSQLRRLLPPPARIVTQASTYRLEIDAGLVDAERFDALIAAADGQRNPATPTRAAALLAEALALWRGPPYSEFTYDEFARAEVDRLNVLRELARRRWLEARLALGEDAAAEAGALVAEQPLDERAHQLAMIALYRVGRQSEALALYRELRTRLAGDLGLEPSRATRDLHAKILRHDPGLAPAASGGRRWPPLPAPPNRLIGRERELAEVRQLLAAPHVRLVVLTGAGGSGKTRLALELAQIMSSEFAGGGAFVSLAAVRDPELVAPKVADALGIERAAEPDAWAVVQVALQTEELLLVIDNVEHLREATPAFAELVAAAPRVRLLVTSRVVLHLSGEHVYPVGPLELEAGVELFRERANAADPETVLLAEEETIRQICAKLDTLPLALELAAGRARTLSPPELLRRLDRRLPLLSAGPRDLPARQQTLRATIEWSYSLLSETEQALLRDLSIFAKPPALGAIEAVCNCRLETLEALVDHNFLVRAGVPEPRFAMLETVREFALERLAESREREAIRRRHADHIVAEAERATDTEPGAGGTAPPPEDIRLAIEFLVEHGDPHVARLVLFAGRHWHAEGRLAEAHRFLDAALAAPTDDATRAELLGLAAHLNFARGELAEASRAVAEAMELARRIRDERLEAWLTAISADVAVQLGEPVDALLPRCEQAANRLHRAADASRLADVLVTLGTLRYWTGGQSEATGTLQQAIAVAQQTRNRAAELSALEWLAVTYIDLRTPTDAAIAQQEQLLRLAQGAPRTEAGILMPLAWLYAFAGRFDEARRTLGRSIDVFTGFGAPIEVASAAQNAGWIELLAGDPVSAERALRQGLDQLAALNERGYLATTTIILAEALYQQGRYGEAAREARAALEMTLPAVEQAWALATRAKAEAHQGDIEAATRCLADVDARLGKGARNISNLIQGELLLARGEVERLAGDCRAAAALYAKAETLYAELRAWPLASRAKRLLDEVRPVPRPAR